MATQTIRRSKKTRSEKLDLRITSEAKRTLQAAASASHRSVSDFVLESAMSRAEEALADRQIFTLNSSKWKAFIEALDAPPRPMPEIQKLFSEPGFFDSPKAKK